MGDVRREGDDEGRSKGGGSCSREGSEEGSAVVGGVVRASISSLIDDDEGFAKVVRRRDAEMDADLSSGMSLAE